NILAPLRTQTLALWAPLDGDGGYRVILYPFVHGDNAKVVGLSAEQWREFGMTLRAVHDSGLEARFRGQLRTETFTLPSAALLRQVMATLNAPAVESPTAAQLASFLYGNRERIEAMLARAEELGRALQTRRFEMGLCHADIHTANILVGDEGCIWLIDWDGPMIAPRERDLLFVIGSRIARPVSPDDEDHFFDGYGPVDIDPDALIYYRYERIIEDLGEFGRIVLFQADVSESTRQSEAALAMSFFEPNGDLARAETVSRLRWPR
ncbi:MAG TPA: aminoglycoside phosphotransferase family protein, partial [Thermomicrobiales bacterium]|nr:aminoglycoside phosphotransferase family protein [Thermomicrobiales bacterium]